MNTQYDAMREAEAQEWIARVRKEGNTRASGDERLRGILADIAKRRGQTAADDLKARIERQIGRSL